LTAETNSTRIGTITEPEAAPKNARPTINNTLPLSLTSSSQERKRVSQKD
jgi:hypothetical protein